MNALLPTQLLLTIQAEPGTLFLAVLLVTLTIAFPLRMERNRWK